MKKASATHYFIIREIRIIRIILQAQMAGSSSERAASGW